MKYMTPVSLLIIATGVAVFILSFFSDVLEVQIALIIAAVGLASVGVVSLGYAQKRKQDEARHQEVIAKLEELKQEIESLKQSGKGGVAIADVIGTGLKYFTDYMSQDKEEEKKDD